MMAHTTLISILPPWAPSLPLALLLLPLATLLTYILYLEYHYRSLSHLPGPFFARYTNIPRAYLAHKHRERPTGYSWHTLLHARYGSTVRVGPKTVFTNDPAAIPVILGFKQRLEKSGSVNALVVPGVRTGIVGIRDEVQHARYRRPVQGAYSLSSLKAYQPAVDEMIEVLLGVLSKHAQDGEGINISAWCHYFSYDTIMRVTFGAPLGFLANGRDMHNLIANQIKHVSYVCYGTQMPFLDYLIRTNPLIQYLYPRKASPFAAFAAEKIREQAGREKAAEARGEIAAGEQRTLLAHFLDAKRKFPDVVDDVQVRSYCTSNTLAGSLNPSKVMDLICQYLVQHPRAQERLYAEIQTTGCAIPVSMEATLRMPYLEGLVREAYRLHKGADIAIERSITDPAGITLPDGTYLPQGVDVGLSTPAMRTLPVFGSEPEEFRPERWMWHKEESEAQWRARRLDMERADLTFGAGSRACLGKSFTHLEVFKAVASIFGRFKLEPVAVPERYDVQVRVVSR